MKRLWMAVMAGVMTLSGLKAAAVEWVEDETPAAETGKKGKAEKTDPAAKKSDKGKEVKGEEKKSDKKRDLGEDAKKVNKIKKQVEKKKGKKSKKKRAWVD